MSRRRRTGFSAALAALAAAGSAAVANYPQAGVGGPSVLQVRRASQRPPRLHYGTFGVAVIPRGVWLDATNARGHVVLAMTYFYCSNATILLALHGRV